MRSVLKMPSDDMLPNERERALHCDARKERKVRTKAELCKSRTMQRKGDW